MSWFKYNLPRILIFFTILLLAYSIWVVITKAPPEMPFIGQGRDWIGVFGEMGKAFGIIALLGLVYEISHRGNEAKKKSTPHLRVLSYSTETAPNPSPDENNYYLHLGDSNNDLTSDEYNAYNSFNSQTADNGNKYFKFVIQNSSSNYESAAKNPQLNITIKYNNIDDFSNSNSVQKSEFTYLLNGVSFFPNEKKNIYIKISPSARLVPYRVFVKAIISKINCYNLNNDYFRSRMFKFQEFQTDSFRLIDENAEENLLEALNSISAGLVPQEGVTGPNLEEDEDVVGSEDDNISGDH